MNIGGGRYHYANVCCFILIGTKKTRRKSQSFFWETNEHLPLQAKTERKNPCIRPTTQSPKQISHSSLIPPTGILLRILINKVNKHNSSDHYVYSYIPIMFPSLFSFFIIAAVTVTVAYAQTTTTNPCEPRVSSVTPCHLSVSVNQQCKSAIISFPGTNFTNSCNSTEIFWNYPQNNFTFIIDTPFTATHQRYTLQLSVYPRQPQMFRVFQVQTDGATTELKFRSDIITVRSDSNFQVGLKFQGPSRFIVYGVYIRYDVVLI